MPDKTFAGKVERILPRADRSKATVKVRVAFKLCPQKLLPDMSVRVRFLPDDAPEGADEGKAKEKLVVPVEALAEGNFVWVVDEKKLARKVQVTVGEKNKKVAEIVSGLAPTDKVVIEGHELLQRDGQKVRLSEGPK
jgi:multidrug efflux pump subunit AcrA (membrane-fusion protein)